MFEFLSATLRCIWVSAKWFSMSSGDFFDEMLKLKLQLYFMSVIFVINGILKKTHGMKRLDCSNRFSKGMKDMCFSNTPYRDLASEWM